MGGQAEQTIEKPSASAKGASPTTATGAIGGLRIHKNHGEVHIHDDKNNLKFVLDEGPMHDVYWPEFVSKRAIMDQGQKVALIGKTDKQSGNRKSAVLVCEKLRSGGYEYYLEEFNDNAVYDFEVGKDEVIEKLNQWVAQNL